MAAVTPGTGDSGGKGAKRRPDNVIILTGGLTGSSALAGLLTAAGYWCGEDTFKKSDYNTYENAELIRLNRLLMKRVSVGEEYTTIFQPEAISNIAALVGVESTDEYRAFVETCNQHAPWVWKDPRLWLTIRFWSPLVNWTNTKVLLLTREPLQAWISAIQRRQIQTFGYLTHYNEAIQASLRGFLSANDIDYLPVQYESIVLEPEKEIARISSFIGGGLHLDHLTSTYSGPLGRRPKNWRDAIEAGLIYLKNFSQRLR